MNFHREMVGLGLVLFVATALGLTGQTDSSVEIVRRDSIVQNNVADLVVLIDDYSVAPAPAGCDAITIHNYRSGLPIDRGLKHVSPGRLAARADLSLIVANPANGCGRVEVGGPRPLNPSCVGWLAMRQVMNGDFRSIRDGFYTGVNVATKGGIAFADDDTLLLATAKGLYANEVIGLGAPYGIARLEMPGNLASDGRIFTPLASRGVDGPVGEIIPVRDTGSTLLVTTNGAVLQVQSDTLVDLASPIPYPTAISPRNKWTQTMPAIDAFHATATRDGAYVFVGRMFAGDVAIIDVARGVASVHPIAPDIDFVGGVAINGGWINPGLLAVHAVDNLAVLRFDPPDSLVLLSELSITPPFYGTNSVVNGGNGPLFSIEWTADGSHLIAATTDGQAEFAVVQVSDGGSTLQHVRSLTACPDGANWPNDIWTANGLITPTATATSEVPPTLTPSPTPSRTPSSTATNTPSPTATGTETSSPSATPTTIPGPIYLPLALAERCDPTTQRIDVALVIDASSSMGDLTRSGRPKIDAALDAARVYLDLLALDAATGDQAAIVAFNADAQLVAPLTSDRSALDAALRSITLAQLTRLDRAVAVGAEALADATRRRPVNQPVLVLLTDGKANPVPVEVAVAEATRAKEAGVTLFTIGLGDDIDAAALADMASTPSGFLRAPDAEELADVYREVARGIPCPASVWWGGR